MSHPLMKCGHAANAVRQSDGAPVCAICYGISAGADEPVMASASSEPDLSKRQAKCSYDNSRGRHRDSRVQSNTGLAFFAYKPDEEYDQYYCGCFGWD